MVTALSRRLALITAILAVALFLAAEAIDRNGARQSGIPPNWYIAEHDGDYFAVPRGGSPDDEALRRHVSKEQVAKREAAHALAGRFGIGGLIAAIVAIAIVVNGTRR